MSASVRASVAMGLQASNLEAPKARYISTLSWLSLEAGRMGSAIARYKTEDKKTLGILMLTEINNRCAKNKETD